MTSRAARILIATLAGVLSAAAGHAETGWTLWERPLDPITGRPRSEWRPQQRFEAERWCKGAMTRAINQTLAEGRDGNPRDPKAKVTEYQCLPESADPREATRK